MINQKFEKNLLVLLIEDDKNYSVLMETYFQTMREQKYFADRLTLHVVESSAEALKLLSKNHYHLVLLDLNLPDSSGTETLQVFENYYSDIPFIVLTGSEDNSLALQSIQLGIQDFLIKGEFNYASLNKTIRYALERHKLHKIIQDLALVDSLTQIHNRRGFLHLLEQQIKIATRINKQILLLYLDLDNFKTINDTYGHSEGDWVLQEVAHLLQNVFRNADIIARIGGDEFTVLLSDTNIQTPQELSQRLVLALERYNAELEKEYEIEISLGFGKFDPEAPCSPEELISVADKSMYHEKKLKKDKA